MQFGEVADLGMQVNQFSKIVKECWHEIPDHFPHVELDEFVIMPNHVHGIKIMNESKINDDDSVGATSRCPRSDDKSNGAADIGATQRRPYKIPLGKIVVYFKNESTKRINEINDSHGTKI